MSAKNDVSLIVPVSEARHLQRFREQYLHRPGVTMPPHITISSPLQSIDEVNERVLDVLRRIIAAKATFRFQLSRIGRWEKPGVLYLVPEPMDGFQALHDAICMGLSRKFEDTSVYHLTLAGWYPEGLAAVEEAFTKQHGEQLPIMATASEVWLYEQVGNVWLKRDSFGLAKTR